MKEFKRIFKYVRPQWPRIIVVVCSALLIAILFAGSFATVIPLLKVMMDQEGIHGWVDRKICQWRYDVRFYVPESVDLTDAGHAYYILVADVEEEGKAVKAGLKQNDRIVGAGSALVTGQNERVARREILQQLATAPKDGLLEIQIKRLDEKTGSLQMRQMGLDTEDTAFYVDATIDFSEWTTRFVPRGGGRKNMVKAVVFIIILMTIATVLRCLARFYQQYMAEKIVQVTLVGLREDAFAHTLQVPIGFFSTEGTSDTISRLMVDISGMGKGVKILFGKALREPLKAIACLIVALMISWKLVLMFLGCAPFTLGLAVLLGRKMKKYTKRSLVSSAQMFGKLKGVMSALNVVKVYNRQDYEVSAYKLINRKYLKQILRIAKVQAATGPIMEVVGMIAGSAALIVGVHWIAMGNMDSPSFFCLLILLGTAAESIRKSSDVWNKIQSANAAAERVFEVMDRDVEFEKDDAVQLPLLKEKIEFRDVEFTYPGAEGPVLRGVNLTVEAGHNIAIVGPNGSGKTTLANLLPRFYNPDSGSILIDGMDIRDCTLKSLREQIGIVSQNVVTFNDTVAANIAYGKPDATMEQIIDAARRSYADEFVSILPDGYDTVIGEDGVGLSGGQLQRIVIARAILRNPAILIFDEATSQIDASSEAKIHKAIEEIMKDRTSFIIAHRFSTIISADMIVVMDDGLIVAQGKHHELVEQCPLYQSLYEKQLIAV